MDIIKRFWRGVHSVAVLEVVQTLVLSELCFLCSQRRASGVQRPFVVVILQMLYCNSSMTKGCSTTTSSKVIRTQKQLIFSQILVMLNKRPQLRGQASAQVRILNRYRAIALAGYHASGGRNVKPLLSRLSGTEDSMDCLQTSP